MLVLYITVHLLITNTDDHNKLQNTDDHNKLQTQMTTTNYKHR